MVSHLTGKQLISTAMLGTAAMGGLSGESLHTITIITGFVGAILAGFVWIRAQWKADITAHAQEEQQLNEQRYQRMLAEFKLMLAEHRAEDREET